MSLELYKIKRWDGSFLFKGPLENAQQKERTKVPKNLYVFIDSTNRVAGLVKRTKSGRVKVLDSARITSIN